MKLFKNKNIKDITYNYNDVVEVWLTPKNNKTQYEVKIFYNEDNKYIKVEIKNMYKDEAIQYIQTLKNNNIKLHRLEIPGRIMYRNTKLYYKIFPEK